MREPEAPDERGESALISGEVCGLRGTYHCITESGPGQQSSAGITAFLGENSQESSQVLQFQKNAPGRIRGRISDHACEISRIADQERRRGTLTSPATTRRAAEPGEGTLRTWALPTNEVFAVNDVR